MLLIKCSGIIGRDQSEFNCRIENPFVINTPAIIFHFNEDMIAPMIGANGKVSVVSLAVCVTFLVFFQSMCNSVPYEVNEWVADLLNDVVIEFSLGTGK